MNKKINYLAIIPIYGTVILMIYLFVLMAKNRIDKRKFVLYFTSVALFGFLSILFFVLLFKFMYINFDIQLLYDYGLLFAFILGGYAMNAFAFIALKKVQLI